MQEEEQQQKQTGWLPDAGGRADTDRQTDRQTVSVQKLDATRGVVHYPNWLMTLTQDTKSGLGWPHIMENRPFLPTSIGFQAPRILSTREKESTAPRQEGHHTPRAKLPAEAMPFLELSSMQADAMSVSVWQQVSGRKRIDTALLSCCPAWPVNLRYTGKHKPPNVSSCVLMQTPKASGAGQLTWTPSHSPASSVATDVDGAKGDSGSTTTTACVEHELLRLRAWHPQHSRFQKEARKSEGGVAPAASFSHEH